MILEFHFRREADMKAVVSLCCATVLVLGMAACNSSDTMAPPPDTRDADVKAIGDTEALWNKELMTKDIDLITNHYADDAVLMTSGAAPAQGRDAIRNAMRELFSDSAMNIEFHASRIEVSKSGELGYSLGTYRMTLTDPATHKVVTNRGSYVTTYRKQLDGSWKAVADIATPEGPDKNM